MEKYVKGCGCAARRGDSVVAASRENKAAGEPLRKKP